MTEEKEEVKEKIRSIRKKVDEHFDHVDMSNVKENLDKLEDAIDKGEIKPFEVKSEIEKMEVILKILKEVKHAKTP